MSMEDLATILVPPPTQAVTYGQGKILSWDPDTFENAIEWRGITLHNLPVLSGAEALTYQSGDVVGLLGWAPNPGATGSWWILGRLVLPGAGRAEAAIQWMTSTLGAALARSVMGEAVYADSMSGFGVDAPAAPNWGDLDDGAGPTLDEVEIVGGRAIISVTAQITVGVADSANAGFMSFEVSGASTLQPNVARALALSITNPIGSALFARATATFAVNLNPGVHTIQAKYQRATASSNPSFGQRTITAIAF